MKNVLKLMTYNVHSAIGSDKKRDYDRIIKVIREIDPHIINLQEVDLKPHASNGRQSFLFEKINSNLDYSGVKGITMLKSDSAFGNAMFVKAEPHKIENHDISFGKREPRGVMDCLYKINGNTLRVINTHLGLKKRERIFQFGRIKELLQDKQNVPTLLSGDFNEWQFRSRQLQHLKQHVDMVNRQNTFPARYPVFALDLMFYNKGLKLMNYKVHQSILSRQASDHLPLTGNFLISKN